MSQWDYNEQGLIVDGDEIRNCENNHAKMSVWQIAMVHTNYSHYLRKIDAEVLGVIVEAVLMLFNILILLLFLPVWPFIGAYFTKKKAMKAVAIENKVKAKRKAREQSEK